MNTTKAILFDYDDTLVKTKLIQVKAIQETGKKFYGVELTKIRILEKWGEPLQSLFEFIFEGLDTFEEVARKYKSVRINYPMEPYEDAVRVVNNLVEKYEVGVVTASTKDFILEDLKQLGFAIDKFFKIQTAEDTNVHKPDPKVFEPILSELEQKNIVPSEVLYVGDSLRDQVAAIGAGMKFLGVAFSPENEEVFIQNNAKFAKSFDELAGFILK